MGSNITFAEEVNMHYTEKMAIQNGWRDIFANKLTIKTVDRKMHIYRDSSHKIVEDYNLDSCVVLRKASYYYSIKLQHHWTWVQ